MKRIPDKELQARGRALPNGVAWARYVKEQADLSVTRSPPMLSACYLEFDYGIRLLGSCQKQRSKYALALK